MATLYAQVRQMLQQAAIPEADAKARMIVAEALGVGLGDVFLLHEVSETAQARVLGMARRCAAGEPVQYVTGVAYFRYNTLHVCADVLIPRQETELVVQEAIDLIATRGYKTALDMCTGSGCIAVALQTETNVRTEACDISEAALAVARGNAAENGADVRFFLSDMFSNVDRTYDIIVCNPPYISEREYATLDDSVRRHEPALALIAGDGLDFYRLIAAQSPSHIRPGGALVLEIGAKQGADVAALLEAAGFKNITCKKDYAGRDRIISARRQ